MGGPPRAKGGAMNLSDKDKIKLWREALKAANFSYSPYSHFPVGAAIKFSDGSVVTGCNVENRSFGLTNCAERTAAFSAISQGKDLRHAVALAIAAPAGDTPTPPCGACRQVLTEFIPPDALVIFGASEDALLVETLGGLYPFDSLHDLGNK